MMFKKNWFNENVTEFLHANVGYCSEVNFMSKYFVLRESLYEKFTLSYFNYPCC